MATYTTLASLFSAIADAIRAKTGSSAEIVADDFPDEIAAISGGSSGIVYVMDEQDEHGGIVRHLTTDGATITDTTDAAGGTIKSITGTEVTLQAKRVTPGATRQVIEADQGFAALGKVIVEASSMIVELTQVNNVLTADHTFAEIFEALKDGTPVFLHLPADGGDDWAEEYTTSVLLLPVIRCFKYNNYYRVAAAMATRRGVNLDAQVEFPFHPGIVILQAAGINSYPTYYRVTGPSENFTNTDLD